MTFATDQAGGSAQPGISAEAFAAMMFDANKKQAVVAYLLWFFLGYFGAHNFYLKRTCVAVAQLLLTLTIVGIAITFFWVLVDAFLIPGWVRRENNLLVMLLGGRREPVSWVEAMAMSGGKLRF
jgi:TM2 domain-containing membrane protein YozV